MTRQRIAPSHQRGRTAARLISLVAFALAGCDLMPPKPVYKSRAEAQAALRANEVERPADVLVDGKVLLGSPSLTAGITGSGPLALAEIETWLADPKNHEPLEFVLPLGLRSLAGEVRVPPDNPLTRAKIELGRQLFVDPRLSPVRKEACFGCHVPRQGYASHALPGDPEKGVPRRAPPSLVNRIFSDVQFWDGRAATLEEQVLQPIFSPYEMGNTPAGLLEFLRSSPGYARQFEVIFGELNTENVARALASFVRTLVSGSSPYDYWLGMQEWKGRDPATLDPAQRAAWEELRRGSHLYPLGSAAAAGHALFVGKAKCVACHSGANFTDEKFHNVGVGHDDFGEPDEGRYEVTRLESDRGAFKTPTLRQIAQSGPYMHRNQFGNLEEVVAYLSAGGAPGTPQDPLLQKLELTQTEQRQLTAFLVSLSSPLPGLPLGRLPE